MILYVIRHGETEWNRKKLLQGWHGEDLNERGVLLAELTAEGLKDTHFDLCYTSPLIRARHTAEIILKGRDVPIIEDDRLKEICFGEWEGKSCDLTKPMEIDRENFILLQTDSFRYQAPKGGETVMDVIDRCADFFAELTSDPSLADKTILISTHGAACRALLNPFYEDRTSFWQTGVPMNCAVSILEVKDKKTSFLAKDKVYYPEQYFHSYYKLPDGIK